MRSGCDGADDACGAGGVGDANDGAWDEDEGKWCVVWLVGAGGSDGCADGDGGGVAGGR